MYILLKHYPNDCTCIYCHLTDSKYYTFFLYDGEHLQDLNARIVLTDDFEKLSFAKETDSSYDRYSDDSCDEYEIKKLSESDLEDLMYLKMKYNI